MEAGIKASRSGAVLIGADGLGPWEKEEMYALLQQAVSQGKSVIPVLLPAASAAPDLPLFLQNRTWVDLRLGFDKEGMDRLIWGITGEKPPTQPATPPPLLPTWVATRLRHGADPLFGREQELARLDTAWHDPKTHVVSIVAWGGVGKTSLVMEWMARQTVEGWPGFERVFDWSFYSQGTREQSAASADSFIAASLTFFGDEAMANSAASPWDKGARLAQLVAARRTLLVLDGIEPLQHLPGPMAGQLKDPALTALLRGLAQRNPGLCLVTTRERVADLAPFRETTAPEWQLQHLSIPAGVELLRTLGVKGAKAEFEQLVEDVKGHALTLNLLGRFLAEAYGGDIRKRDMVRFEEADAEEQGGHAFRVMAAYEGWFTGEGEKGQGRRDDPQSRVRPPQRGACRRRRSSQGLVAQSL